MGHWDSLFIFLALTWYPVKSSRKNKKYAMIKERSRVPRLNSLRSISSIYLTGQARFRVKQRLKYRNPTS
jgi:hypothetical protein